MNKKRPQNKSQNKHPKKCQKKSQKKCHMHIEHLPPENQIIIKMSKQFAKDKQYLYPGITQDDVEQECNRIGLESLPEFDPSRANIKTFLFLKMKTKLLNWKRDNYYRPGTKTDYKKKINSAEQLDLDIWEDLPDNDHSKDMFLLEESIPSELRDDWHRLKEGIPISVKQKSKILKVVRQIIYEEIHEGTDKQIDKQTGKEIG